MLNIQKYLPPPRIARLLSVFLFVAASSGARPLAAQGLYENTGPEADTPDTCVDLLGHRRGSNLPEEGWLAHTCKHLPWLSSQQIHQKAACLNAELLACHVKKVSDLTLPDSKINFLERHLIRAGRALFEQAAPADSLSFPAVANFYIPTRGIDAFPNAASTQPVSGIGEDVEHLHRVDFQRHSSLTFCQSIARDHILPERMKTHYPRCLALLSRYFHVPGMPYHSEESQMQIEQSSAAQIVKTMGEKLILHFGEDADLPLKSRENEKVAFAALSAVYHASEVAQDLQSSDEHQANSIFLLFRHLHVGLWAKLRQEFEAWTGSRVDEDMTRWSALDMSRNRLQEPHAFHQEVQLMRAMFMDASEESPGLSKRVFRILLSDCLQGLEYRLASRGYLFDFVKSVAQPRANMVPFEAVNRFVAAFANTNAIDSLLPACRTLQQHPGTPELAQICFIAHEHRESIKDMLAADIDDILSPSPFWRQELDRFVSVTCSADSRQRSMAATGYFTTPSESHITTGLAARQRQAVRQELSQKNVRLETELRNLAQDRNLRLTAEMTNLERYGQRLVQDQELQRLRARFNTVARNLSGRQRGLEALIANQAIDRRRFQDLLESSAEANQLPAERNIEHPISDADRRPHSLSRSIDEHRIEAVPVLTLAAGDSLYLKVSGTWQPTRAMSNHMPDVDFSRIIVGSDGFSLQGAWSVGQADTQASAKITGSRHETRWTAEGHFGFEVPFKILSFGASMSLSETDSSFSEQQRSSHQSSTQNISRNCSWLGEINLADTPVPNRSAGALLVVALPRGNTSLADALHLSPILGGNHIYQAPVDSDIHFIANDYLPEQGTLPTAAAGLVLEGSIRRNPAAQIAELAAHVFSIVNGSEEALIQLLGNHDIDEADIEAVRARASAEIGAGCFANIAHMPAVRDIVTAIISHQIDQVRIRQRIVLLTQELQDIETAMIRQNIIKSNLQEGQKASYIAASLISRSIFESEFDCYMQDARELILGCLYPLIKIRSTVTEQDRWHRQMQPHLAALSAELWSAQPHHLANLWLRVSQRLEDGLQEADRAGFFADERRKRVALTFHRPGANMHGRQNKYRSATEEQSAELWRAIDEREIFRLRVSPADLYTGRGTRCSLAQNEMGPILTSLTLAFDVGEAEVEDEERAGADTLMVDVTGSVIFPTSSGTKSFVLSPELSRFNANIVFTDIGRYTGNAANILGLPAQQVEASSPFAGFDVDFSALTHNADQLRKIQDSRSLTVLFEVDVDGRGLDREERNL